MKTHKNNFELEICQRIKFFFSDHLDQQLALE